MNKNKIISGCISLLVGAILFFLVIDALTKPSNISLSLQPLESLKTYFFGFAFSMGTIGWVLGSLLLTGYFIAFYIIGIWIYKKWTKD